MEQLINQLIREGYLKTPSIIEAFRKVRRMDFLTEEMRDQASLNIPLPIHFGQTISQPLTVAFMLELLQPKAGDKILDVGAGSGWQTALLAYIVGERGRVVAIERIPQLVQFARKNLESYRFPHVTVMHGDGSHGVPDEAPFDKIIVAAASKQVPHILLEQLAAPGLLVMPIGEWDQDMVVVSKSSSGDISQESYPGFQFVPLIEGELPPSLHKK